MIDTIVIRKPIANIQEAILDKALNNVTFERNVVDNFGVMQSRIGKYENFSVKVSQTILRIEGSLTKFLLGNNIEMLSCEQIGETLSKLNKAFPGINLLTGHLSRVDVAECFVMDQKPSKYFRNLLETPNLDRSPNFHGVRYSRGKKEGVFYDKTEDAIKDYRTSSVLYDNGQYKHLLRFELRIKSQARRLLMNDVKMLTPIHLLSRNLQYLLAQEWYRFYERIHKRRTELGLNISDISSWKVFKDHLALTGIETRGLKDWILLLHEISHTNQWSPKKKSEAKHLLQKLYQSSMPPYVDRIAELNSKIERSEIFTRFFRENGRVLKKD